MSLISLIQQHALAQAQAGQWEAVSAALNYKSMAVRNPKQWTLGEIEQSLGADAARTIAGAIKNAAADDPLMESAFVAVSTSGIQLHTEQRQAMIAAIGQTAGLSAEQIAAMQALGVTTKSVLEAAGYSGMTAAGLQAAWDHHRVQQMRQQWRDVAAQVEAVISAADLGRAEAVVAAVQSALEG